MRWGPCGSYKQKLYNKTPVARTFEFMSSECTKIWIEKTKPQLQKGRIRDTSPMQHKI